MYKLSISYLLTSVNDWGFAFIAPLLILNITNSPYYASIAIALEFLPFILITPIAGYLSDKYNRKNLLQASEIITFFFVIAMLLLISNSSNIYLIFLLVFLISASCAIHHPIFQAIIPNLVPDNKILFFNSRINFIENTVSLITPIFIGIILIYVQAKFLLILFSIFYLMSFFIISTFKYNYCKHIENVDMTFFFSMKEAIQYIFKEKIIFRLLIIFLILNLGIKIIGSNMISIYHVFYKMTDSEISFCFSIIGFGSIIGSFFSSRIIEKYNYYDVILFCSFLIGFFTCLLALNMSYLYITVITALISSLTSVIVVAYFTLRQKLVPDFLLGRVIGITRTIAYFSIPSATLIGGFLIEKKYEFGIIVFFSSFFIFIGFFIGFLKKPSFVKERTIY